MAVTMTGYGARSADGDSSLAEGKGPAWRRGEEFEACGVVLTGRIVGGEGGHVPDSTVKVEERGVAVTVFWGSSAGIRDGSLHGVELIESLGW